MLPATSSVPKALLPVAGRPFADLQLAWLAGQGVTDVAYCIGHLGEQIRAHVGDGGGFGLRVRYSDEGEARLGTAGALRRAVDGGLCDDAFLVIYGDSYLSVDVRAVWASYRASGAPALMTVLRNDGRWDRSNTRMGDGRIDLYDKRADPEAHAMRHIDYGLLALSRSVVVELVAPGVPADLADVQHALSVAGRLAGFEVAERFYEIGSPAGRAELEAALLQGRVKMA
jgi:NDP-sugar pyrophosphorylase family protein